MSGLVVLQAMKFAVGSPVARGMDKPPVDGMAWQDSMPLSKMIASNPFPSSQWTVFVLRHVKIRL